jgi:LuxR family transcriptional regulator, regulator of acetate metabolism
VIIEESPGSPADVRAAERVLVELLQLEREVAELEYMRRADALERAAEAIRRLGELGSSDGILGRSAAELGSCAQFDRVLISEVADGTLRPLAGWDSVDQAQADELTAALAQAPIRIEYPLIEADVVRHRDVQIVGPGGGRARGRSPLADAFGDSYAVAALTAQGETIGLLHAGAPGCIRQMDALDAEVAGAYAEGLSGVFERAVLRHTLALHRAELQSAMQWIGGRLSRLSETGPFESGRRGGEADARLVQSLTPRELEVMRLLARGHTNRAIADSLVVREGTVKYHVKNILRKLGATSRADAVARFHRPSSGTGAGRQA